MSANTVPIYPAGPVIGRCSLAAATACTTRAPTAAGSLAGANILALLGTSTNGQRVDKIEVQACSSSITATTAAQVVGIWLSDGTTAYLIEEILVSALAPSTTAVAFTTSKSYSNLVLPATWSLYASTTVTTTASTTALSVIAFGGAY